MFVSRGATGFTAVFIDGVCPGDNGAALDNWVVPCLMSRAVSEVARTRGGVGECVVVVATASRPARAYVAAGLPADSHVEDCFFTGSREGGTLAYALQRADAAAAHVNDCAKVVVGVDAASCGVQDGADVRNVARWLRRWRASGRVCGLVLAYGNCGGSSGSALRRLSDTRVRVTQRAAWPGRAIVDVCRLRASGRSQVESWSFANSEDVPERMGEDRGRGDARASAPEQQFARLALPFRVELSATERAARDRVAPSYLHTDASVADRALELHPAALSTRPDSGMTRDGLISDSDDELEDYEESEDV